MTAQDAPSKNGTPARDPATMRRFLDGYFAPWESAGGRIEIVGLLPSGGAPRASTFPNTPEGREKAVDFASRLNESRNVFFGTGLRTPNAPNGRCKAEHFLGAPAIWVDLDAEGSVEAAEAAWAACPPTVSVTTGAVPARRMHAYWILDHLERDPGETRELVTMLLDRFGGDPSVKDMARIMRLPGSFGFRKPDKEGRIDESVTLEVTGAPVSPAALRAHYGRAAESPAAGNVVPFSPMQALAGQLRAQGAHDPLAAIVERLAGTSSGRNTALAAAAYAVGGIMDRDGLSEADARAALMAACERNGYAAKAPEKMHDVIGRQLAEGRAKPLAVGAAGSTWGVQAGAGGFMPPDLAAARSARAGELLGAVVFADEIEVQPFSPYLIKRRLDWGTISVLYGPSNVGKSFLALDMARAVAAGESWHGRKVQGGGAIYFIAEGERRFANRVAALGGGPSRLAVVPRPLDLFGEVDAAAVIELAKTMQTRIGEVAFIVIDTYARNAGGAEENSAKDVSRVLNHVGDILRETGAHVMLVSHIGKDETRGLRGSSAIKGAVDHMIEVTEEGGVIFANAGEKQRDEAKSDLVFPYRLAVVELAKDQDGEPLTSCRVEAVDPALAPKAKREKPSPSGYAVLEALRQFTADHGEELPGGTGFPDRADRFRGVDLEPFCAFARGKVAGSRQQKSQTVKRGLDDLRAKGYAAQTDDKVWLLKHGVS